LQLARQKAKEAGVLLSAYEQGTATEMSRFAEASFDAVLLMGPLYHLLAEDDRRTALAEARRVLKPGGPLFATFISRYAAHRYATRCPTELLEKREIFETVLNDGRMRPDEAGTHEFVGYFARPEKVAPLCWSVGLEVITTLGVEGLVSLNEAEVNLLSGEAWDTWVDLNYRVAPDPAIHGCVEHLLVVARNPRWRAVLRHIARRLDEAGIAYKVVGGIVLALHGLSVPVKDLDIEVSAEDAYRFQSLFAEYLTQPVSLSESATYCSHFGRFDFDGVLVEVMGDLHRREGDAWVPTMAVTETQVDLDGVPVRVPWLEEETLVYIRRGRLERAARCLPHCTHDRLLAMLRTKPM